MIREFLESGSLFTTAKGKVLIAWKKRKWHSALSLTVPSFYFPDFFLENPKPWCSHEEWVELEVDDLIQEIEKMSLSPLEPLLWESPHKEIFRSAFNELQKAFNSKTLIKAVPYVFEISHHEISKNRLQALLTHLLRFHKKHPVYLYGFWESDHGILGATPEILFHSSIKGNRILETCACAGTKPTKCDDLHFLSDPKENYEHRLVIDGIKDAMTSLGGLVEIKETAILKLSKLSHLMTPMRAHFHQEVSFESIVKALHPSPALGAVPKIAGESWLKRYQKQIPRFRFGAPAGFIYPEKQEELCLVAIRNMQWQKEWTGLAAGCGIVPDSRFDSEWEELQLKIASIKEIFNL